MPPIYPICDHFMERGSVHDKLSLTGWASPVILSVCGGVELMLMLVIQQVCNDPLLRQF
jgi:hypothetical protein